LWLLLRVLLYRVPEQHPWITEAERAHILSDRATSSAQQVNWRPGWLTLLTYRQTWAVVIGRFITDPIWWLYIFWLPSDFFPKSAVASVFGLGGTSAAIASVLYNWGTGRVVDAMGYTPVFVVAGVLGPLGLAATVLLAGRITPIKEADLRSEVDARYPFEET